MTESRPLSYRDGGQSQATDKPALSGRCNAADFHSFMHESYFTKIQQREKYNMR